MLKVYLDNCCYNRPFDKSNNDNVQFETAAKLFIQSLIKYGDIELVSSLILYSEIYENPSKYKKDCILQFVDDYAKEYIGSEKMEEIVVFSNEIMKTGIKMFDAAHIACAIVANCDYFISTDKRLLKCKTERIILLNPIEFVSVWEKMVC
jgi:predicted nucleic acid-binding protein